MKPIKNFNVWDYMGKKNTLPLMFIHKLAEIPLLHLIVRTGIDKR